MSADGEVDYDDVSYVVASRYRVETLAALEDSPATPSAIAERTDLETLDITKVSRALTELRDRGLVVLLVSEERRKGRIYGVRNGAKEILEDVKEVTRSA